MERQVVCGTWEEEIRPPAPPPSCPRKELKYKAQGLDGGMCSGGTNTWRAGELCRRQRVRPEEVLGHEVAHVLMGPVSQGLKCICRQKN